MYVEQLAERLNLTPATISSHLKKLESIGAVKSRREQYYITYSLCPEVFSPRIIDLIGQENSDKMADEREEAYRQDILAKFMKNGKIGKMPAQLKKKLVLVEEITDCDRVALIAFLNVNSNLNKAILGFARLHSNSKIRIACALNRMHFFK